MSYSSKVAIFTQVYWAPQSGSDPTGVSPRASTCRLMLSPSLFYLAPNASLPVLRRIKFFSVRTRTRDVCTYSMPVPLCLCHCHCMQSIIERECCSAGWSELPVSLTATSTSGRSTRRPSIDGWTTAILNQLWSVQLSIKLISAFSRDLL